MLEVLVLLIAPLVAGCLSLVVHRSALLHAINLTSMSLLMAAEIMITSSGIYYYKLTSGEYKTVKKLTIMR